MDSPELSLVQTNLPNLLAVSKAETAYFANALDEAVLAHAGMSQDDLKEAGHDDLVKLRDALSQIDHLEVILAAVKAEPNQAARALLPSIYMNGAMISAQDRAEKTGSVVPGPGSGGEPLAQDIAPDQEPQEGQ